MTHIVKHTMPRVQKSQVTAFSIKVASFDLLISGLVLFCEKLIQEDKRREVLQYYILKLKNFPRRSNDTVEIPARQYYEIVDFFVKAGSDQNKIKIGAKTKKTALEILCEAEVSHTSNIAIENIPTKEKVQEAVLTAWEEFTRRCSDDGDIDQSIQQVVREQVKNVFLSFQQYQLAEIEFPIEQLFEMRTGFRMVPDKNTVEEKKETFAGVVFNSANFQLLTQDILLFASISMQIAAIAQLIKTLKIDTEDDKKELYLRLKALQTTLEEHHKTLLDHSLYASLLEPLQKIREFNYFLSDPKLKLPLFLLSYCPLQVEENIISILSDIYDAYNPLLQVREKIIASIRDLLTVGPENKSSQQKIDQPKRLKQLMGQLQENLQQGIDGFTNLIAEKCDVCLVDEEPSEELKTAVKEGRQILLIRQDNQYFIGYYHNKDQTYVQSKLDLKQEPKLENYLHNKMQDAFTGCVTNDFRLKEAICMLVEEPPYRGSCYQRQSLQLLSMFRKSKQSMRFRVNGAIQELNSFKTQYLSNVKSNEPIEIPKKALITFNLEVIGMRLAKLKGSLSHRIAMKNTEITLGLRHYTDTLVALNDSITMRYAPWKNDPEFLEKMHLLRAEIERLTCFDSRNDLQQREQKQTTKLQHLWGYYNPASGFSTAFDLENVFFTEYQYQQYTAPARKVKNSQFDVEEQADDEREDEQVEIIEEFDSAKQEYGKYEDELIRKDPVDFDNENDRRITMCTPIMPHFFAPNCFQVPAKNKENHSIQMRNVASAEQAIDQWREFYKNELRDETLLTAGQIKTNVGFEGNRKIIDEQNKKLSTTNIIGVIGVETFIFFIFGGAWKIMTDNAITTFMPAEVFGAIGIVFLTLAVVTLGCLIGKNIHQAITKYNVDNTLPELSLPPALAGRSSIIVPHSGVNTQPQSEHAAGIGLSNEENDLSPSFENN